MGEHLLIRRAETCGGCGSDDRRTRNTVPSVLDDATGKVLETGPCSHPWHRIVGTKYRCSCGRSALPGQPCDREGHTVKAYRMVEVFEDETVEETPEGVTIRPASEGDEG